MNGRRQLVALSVGLLLFLAGLAWNAPLSGGLAIGGDDKFELCKAQFLERKPELAQKLWNDQPWLHTWLVAKGFAVFGENAALPRLFTLACTFALVIACWLIMGKEEGLLTWVLFLCFYLPTGEIPVLSCSAMVEPPAMAFAALAAACFCCAGSKELPWWRACLSGGLFAAAVFMKLTALMVAPAFLVLIWQARGQMRWHRLISGPLVGFVVIALGAIAISPTFSFDDLWRFHWKAHQIAFEKGVRGFVPSDVFDDWSILLPVALGLLRACREFPVIDRGTLFATVWLFTDFGVHLWHTPWFGYYAIHFIIPLAILAARGTAWVIGMAWREITRSRLADESEPVASDSRAGAGMSHSIASGLPAVLAATIIACWFAIRLPQFWKTIESIRREETAEDNVFIPLIRQFSKSAHWMYCNDEKVAFHGGVLQPPELIVMSYKRLSTRSLDKQMIYTIARSYKAELLLVLRDGELKESTFQNWLAEERYVRIGWSPSEELWVSPALRPSEAKNPRKLIEALRL